MSFTWDTIFRSGQWLSFRSYTLEERKNIESRIRTLDAQIKSIGEITVFYELQEDSEGNISATERRRGFSVSAGSSLERLVQAYVAMGGNPLDISMFLAPDRIGLIRLETGRETLSSTQPSFGVIYPESTNFYQGPIYVGGFASILKYPPRRLGGRKAPGGDNTSYLSSRVYYARKWVQQSIRYKRNSIEDRIKKLCDLREQLVYERDELIPQAIGGTVSYVASRFEDLYSEGLSLSQIVASIDSLFFVESEENPGEFDLDQINLDVLTTQPTIFQDDPDGREDNTAL